MERGGGRYGALPKVWPKHQVLEHGLFKDRKKMSVLDDWTDIMVTSMQAKKKKVNYSHRESLFFFNKR